MAVDQTLSVVGFDGLAVAGGAGMKSPLFRSADGEYFTGDPSSAVRLNEPNLREVASRGLVTITSSSWSAVPSGVVLYAHERFLNAGANTLALSAEGLAIDEASGLRVTYVERSRALEILSSWGRALNADANAHLRGRPSPQDLLRARSSAERARFAAPPPENREIRFESFVHLASAVRASGSSIDRILRDAARDFSEQDVERIRQRVEARLAGASRPYAREETPAPRPRTARATFEQLSLLPDPADGEKLLMKVTRRAA